MKVILNSDVDNLGRIGDVVNVRDGYARNFLLPRGFAAMANERNKAALDGQLRRLQKVKAQALAEAKKLASSIEKLSLTVSKQVGEDEKIFGSVTTTELETLLINEGVKVNRREIVLSDEIKKVGLYHATVKLHPEVHAKFKVWVVAQ